MPIPSWGGSTNSPELFLLKILSLSDHHSHFWAAIFDFTTFFILPFLHRPHLFLQFGCFCVDNFIAIIIFIKQSLQIKSIDFHSIMIAVYQKFNGCVSRLGCLITVKVICCVLTLHVSEVCLCIYARPACF